jgi:Holliday junction resolvase
VPNAAYQRGAARERNWAERREAQGYLTVRGAGSKGPYDVLCLRAGEILLEQVKTDRRGPYSNFGPAARQALLLAAERAGGKANLIWWPPDRNGPRILPSDTWP